MSHSVPSKVPSFASARDVLLPLQSIVNHLVTLVCIPRHDMTCSISDHTPPSNTSLAPSPTSKQTPARPPRNSSPAQPSFQPHRPPYHIHTFTVTTSSSSSSSASSQQDCLLACLTMFRHRHSQPQLPAERRRICIVLCAPALSSPAPLASSSFPQWRRPRHSKTMAAVTGMAPILLHLQS